jgi:predicted  nucleic acid-binding Zn-ribbon protein
MGGKRTPAVRGGKAYSINRPKDFGAISTTTEEPIFKGTRTSRPPRTIPTTRQTRPSTETRVNGKPETNETLAQQLVMALDAEIETMKNPKKGDSGSSIRIYHGRFLRRTGDVYLYVFSLENFLAGMAMDDIPAEVEIAGTRHSGQIASVQGLEITVGLSENLGPYIAQAVLITNLWYLLEAVKKKIVALADANDLPEFSMKAFGIVTSASGNTAYPPLEPGERGGKVYDPNDDAKKAIALALGSEVSFVWGPPGTGKTTVLARIVEAFWKSGKRVLICSHTNTAVNTALEKFLDVVHGLPQYEGGKFIRIGVAGDKLGDSYPLCVVENIAAKLGFELKHELDAIRSEQGSIESQIRVFREIRRLSAEIGELDGQLRHILGECEQVTQSRCTATNELAGLQKERQETRRKYEDSLSAGALRRFFTGMNPERLQKRINAIGEELVKANSRVAQLNAAMRDSQGKQDAVTRATSALQEELSSLCAKFGQPVEAARTQLEVAEHKLSGLASRSTAIERELNEIGKTIVRDAEVVGATLTKVCTGRDISDKAFDVLILDEASMAPLPYLYLALKGKAATCLIGDFKQLPPICQSRDEIAKKWLGQSIFKQSGIEEIVEKRQQDARLQMLHTQYRMVQDIAAIPNRLFYNNALRTECNKEDGDFLVPKALVVCDTSNSGAWVSRLTSGSRYNVYHALIAGRLAKQLMATQSADEVGIITPYAAQARLIKKILDDELPGKPPPPQPRVSTVHRFQGSECKTIIVDTVESYPEKVSILLDDSMSGSDADKLLNVAITRPETKLVIIANLRFLQTRLSPSRFLMQILGECCRNGAVVDTSDLVDDYFCEDFDRLAANLLPIDDIEEPDGGSLYDEKNFFHAFINDLMNAEKEVTILSPFLTTRRAESFGNIFQSLVKRGVRVAVYTRPISSQSDVMAEEARRVIEALQQLGVVVIQRSKMHQKIALIDGCIAWEGSLNILSHRDTGEHMRRLPYQKTVEKLIEFLDVRKGVYDETPPLTNLNCDCGSPILVRKGRYGVFLSCSGFPVCKLKPKFPDIREILLERACKLCGDKFVLVRGRSGWFARCRNSQCEETLTIK